MSCVLKVRRKFFIYSAYNVFRFNLLFLKFLTMILKFSWTTFVWSFLMICSSMWSLPVLSLVGSYMWLIILLDCRTVSGPDTSPTDTSPWTNPRRDNSPTGHFPEGHFPDWTLPQLNISPLRHFPKRTFRQP